MKYYFFEPEVAGELGQNTVIDSTVYPPTVHRLHYEFSGWLGDALVESFPCIISTEDAAEALRKSSVSGVSYSDVEISKSSEFREMYPDRDLPKFVWLKISGEAGGDDFGMADDHRLVISETALDVLRKFGVGNAIVEEFF